MTRSRLFGASVSSMSQISPDGALARAVPSFIRPPARRTRLASAATKAVQGDLGWTVEAYGHDARSSTHRRVADHVVMLPGPSPHPSRQRRPERDRDPSRQADLAAVGMAAQHQIEIGVGRLAINFRGVRQQNRELTIRYLQRRFFDVVHPIEMRVVDSG